MAFYAPDVVHDMSPVGMGVFEGQAAVRGFIADWWTSYEESEFEAEETLDPGDGVREARVAAERLAAGRG